ncbi:MAG: Ldh family oxidoreductase [Actinomycetota bacterium]|nr:Ldh family oxidoreductase [Actinomycetota bacterium]
MSATKEGKNEPQIVPIEWLKEAVTSIFDAAGLSARAASAVAESLVDADRRGIPSHGAMLVTMYVDRLRQGSVTMAEEAEVVLDAGVVAVLDAHHALGQLTGDQAMDLAVSKAKAHGLGAVAVRRAFHFGGAFRYVQAAARAGCVGVAAANTRPLMPAPGGAAPVVGNNPLAFGIPNGGDEPIVLDMALSEAALGKIRIAASEGREIPATWAADADGQPTTDPEAAIAGMLLPIGGPKGYGLALVVDVLTGVLSAGQSGAGVKGLYADTSIPNDCAHFFLALDIESFGDPQGFADRLRELVAQVTSSPRASGVDRLLLPGQLEAERFAASAEHGVAVSDSTLAGLRDAAALVGGSLPSDG